MSWPHLLVENGGFCRLLMIHIAFAAMYRAESGALVFGAGTCQVRTQGI